MIVSLPLALSSTLAPLGARVAAPFHHSSSVLALGSLHLVLQLGWLTNMDLIVSPSFTCSLSASLRKQHDAQLDYYGKRLATCSSDKTIRVFDVVDGEPTGQPDILKGFASQSNFHLSLRWSVTALASSSSPSRFRCWPFYLCWLHSLPLLVLSRSHSTSHNAPIWQLSWAHPSFGAILASASYDGKVFVWKEKGRAALGAPPNKSAAGAGAKGAYGGAGAATAAVGAGERWEVIKEHSLHRASGESKDGSWISQRGGGCHHGFGATRCPL